MSEFKDIWYTSEDGLTLYARDYPCESDSSLTVLCMHGLTRNSADFEDLAPALTDLARVVSVDQRGRGRSDWDSNSAKYTPGTYVGDMFSLIKHLKLENIVLVGTSMGGLMSILMVTMKPDLFRGVVLNDIGPVVSQEGLDRIKGYVGKGKPVKTWEEAIEQTRETNRVAFPAYTDDDWHKWVHRMYEENEQGELTLRYDPAIAEPMAEDDSNAAPADLWPLFDNMTNLPLLTIRGALSDILAEDCVQEMQQRHAGMKLFEVAGVGHAPQLDEPGVVESIRAFISGM
ncbi:MAG: alpha/beta hydrolase [Pseudomonadales bacterium]|jgi:pimeloyl-ACP methyl ester carboxylesterase|nr:alpha/beta hydrolase [Pseudomonadales bacterium]